MSQAIVDREVLLASMGNDVAFLRTVIGIFLEDCPEMLSKIRAGVASSDPVQLMNASHALKGAVSVFGAKEAVGAATTLESMGRQKKLESAREVVCVPEREIALVSSALATIANETA
jgi:HPt (histidine-containing phosphotransfer) domain-containing protein